MIKLCLLGGLFEHSLLQFFLALDAVPSPGDRFQALGINLLATRDALAEGALPNSIQRAFHHLQGLALVVALVKQEFLVIGTGGAIRDILCRIFVGAPPVLLGAGDVSAQLLLPGFQLLFELL